MAGRVVKLLSFNPDDATDGPVESRVATQPEDAESILSDIEAMLADDRFERKRPFLESVHEWVSERGICTPNQREAVENCRQYIERRR
jgi:hypothetical protein